MQSIECDVLLTGLLRYFGKVVENLGVLHFQAARAQSFIEQIPQAYRLCGSAAAVRLEFRQTKPNASNIAP